MLEIMAAQVCKIDIRYGSVGWWSRSAGNALSQLDASHLHLVMELVHELRSQPEPPVVLHDSERSDMAVDQPVPLHKEDITEAPSGRTRSRAVNLPQDVTYDLGLGLEEAMPI